MTGGIILELKLKPDLTKEKAKRYRDGILTVYDKIELIKKYKETVGGEIDGSTVFEGYPLGKMVIVLRSLVQRHINKYDQEVIDTLKDLGVLEYTIIGIAKRVDRLEAFCKTNPKLWRARKVIHNHYNRYLEENLSKENLEKNMENIFKKFRNWIW